jgi:hypothetical protein
MKKFLMLLQALILILSGCSTQFHYSSECIEFRYNPMSKTILGDTLYFDCTIKNKCPYSISMIVKDSVFHNAYSFHWRFIIYDSNNIMYECRFYDRIIDCVKKYKGFTDPHFSFDRYKPNYKTIDSGKSITIHCGIIISQLATLDENREYYILCNPRGKYFVYLSYYDYFLQHPYSINSLESDTLSFEY